MKPALVTIKRLSREQASNALSLFDSSLLLRHDSFAKGKTMFNLSDEERYQSGNGGGFIADADDPANKD